MIGKNFRYGLWIKSVSGSTSITVEANAGTQKAVTINTSTWTFVPVEFSNITGPNNALYVWAAGTATFLIDDASNVQSGVTGEWNAEDAQGNTNQIFDRSGNKNHAKLPASGATRIPVKRDFEVLWTNTWAGTHEAQYIGGVNQAILNSKAYITSIVGTVSGATIEDIIIGDGSDGDRFVTITTGLAAGTTSFSIASPTTDGTNLKLVVDPDANFTGSIAFVIRGYILES